VLTIIFNINFAEGFLGVKFSRMARRLRRRKKSATWPKTSTVPPEQRRAISYDALNQVF
jgi:hypothetical protein